MRCELIDRERLVELEPHVAGVRAIHVPEAGIVNYRQVCEKLAELIRQKGSEIRTSTRVTDIRWNTSGITVDSTGGEVRAKFLVNCAGLQCDRIAKLTGDDPRAKIIPFRGEYYQLKPGALSSLPESDLSGARSQVSVSGRTLHTDD